jgi:hypothetical protein
MTYIEIEHQQSTGWFCNDDLILICDREVSFNDSDSPFMDDRKLQKLTRTCRRYIPRVDFKDAKLFPSIIRFNDEIQLELNSMLACREYVSKQNHFFDRKQFQRAQAAQAEEEKKLEEYQKRQHELNRIRRRQHVSRFDVPSIRKKNLE